jgi:apolipoprotein N-acyltransferase
VFTVSAPGFSPIGGELAVAVIQPGTSLEEKWDPGQWQEMEERVWGLTRAAAADGADVVLWPESAMPFRIDIDETYRLMVTELARELDVVIVLNSVAGSTDAGFTNSAFVIGPDGPAVAHYDKNRLVPFGEYVPSWARFAFTDALVREVGNFRPGVRPQLLDVGVPLGMAVCYEVVFADLITRQVREGAQLLATLTNDGWYGYSWAPHQHVAHVVLRAVENRRWVARAALTGVSGFVAPDGRVVARLDVGAFGHLVQRVAPAESLTVRARMGDWWSVLCWVAAAVLVAVGRARSSRDGGFLLP